MIVIKNDIYDLRLITDFLLFFKNGFNYKMILEKNLKPQDNLYIIDL